MDIDQAVASLSALSQVTRLRVFKLLIEFGPSGAPAGALSDELGIPHNTLSFHLSQLSNAGLVSSRRDGRSIIYSANCQSIEQLIRYLGENCCVRESPQSLCESICIPEKQKEKTP